MKVFQVDIEYCPNDSKEIVTESQFVTCADNSLESVVRYFTKECYEFEKDLKGVREVLTIVQHIPVEGMKDD